MISYFSARASDTAVDCDSDTTFGKMVAFELKKIIDEDVKINAKKPISDMLFSAQQEQRRRGMFLSQHQQLPMLSQQSLLGKQQIVRQTQQPPQFVIVNADGTFQLADK